MKIFTTLLILFYSVSAFAQFDQFPRPGQGQLEGGFGLNYIDGDLHYSFHFRPELSFLNFGVGLDLSLDFDKEGNLRKENFNELSDYFSIIRYVRYGLKNDPLYIRLGAIDWYTLGHGTIMYRYNNNPGFDNRNNGLVVDIDFGQFGFESIYGRFGEAGVVGVRGFVKPLQFTEAASIPVIGNLEVGASFTGDYHENAGVTNGYINPENNFEPLRDEGSINIIGLDIGLPVISTSMFNVELYYDINKIINFGAGSAAGIMVNFGGLGLVTASAKLERRFNGDNYIPSYFNSLYEIQRFRIDTASGIVSSKAHQLEAATDNSNGYYGELGVNVLGLFDIIGSYQRLDKDPESGILFLSTEINPEDGSFLARAGYSKSNIKDEKDLFTLDDRSYLFTELGYKPMPYLLVSMVYSWTFTPVRGANDDVISYEPQRRIEPRISFIFPFDFGGN
ncbi:MAG: hypothetical protein R6W90_02210 [Ignavibacteriaceae bacterium]